MPPIDPNTLVVVLWGLTVVLLGWTWLPALIAALGGTQYRNSYSTDTAELEDKSDDASYRFWYDQVRQLGYEPLGAGGVRVRFYGSEWQHWSASRVFYSKARRTYLFVLRLPHPFGVWYSVELSSPFADGGMLSTSNSGDAVPEFDADYIRQAKNGCGELAELELRHEAALEVCRKRGRQTDADGTVGQLHDLGTGVWAPKAKRDGAKAGWNYLLLHGLIHTCASIPAAEVFGFAHIGVPATNLGLWTLMTISHVAERQNQAAFVRATMAQMIARRNAGRPPSA